MAFVIIEKLNKRLLQKYLQKFFTIVINFATYINYFSEQC